MNYTLWTCQRTVHKFMCEKTPLLLWHIHDHSCVSHLTVSNFMWVAGCQWVNSEVLSSTQTSSDRKREWAMGAGTTHCHNIFHGRMSTVYWWTRLGSTVSGGTVVLETDNIDSISIGLEGGVLCRDRESKAGLDCRLLSFLVLHYRSVSVGSWPGL